MEHAAILPKDAILDPSIQKIIKRFFVGAAPALAVDPEHVSALRPGDRHAVEAVLYIIHREIHIAGQDLAQLLEPVAALVAVGADQGVHGQKIHIIVVRQGGLLVEAVPKILVVNNAVAAHQAGQIESFRRRIKGNRAVPSIVGDGLCRNMSSPRQSQVRPDLVRNNEDIVLFVQGHDLLQLLAFPHAPARIVRRAHNCSVDFVRDNAALHVEKVHAPDTAGVQHEWAVDDFEAVVGQGVGEADVGGRVDQDLAAVFTKNAQGADDAAQDAVLVADVFRVQGLNAVGPGLPVCDGVVVFLPGRKISIHWVFGPLDHGSRDGRDGLKVHVGDPHGDALKAFSGGHFEYAEYILGVDGDGILAMAIDYFREIILHCCSPFGLNEYIIRPRRRFRKCVWPGPKLLRGEPYSRARSCRGSGPQEFPEKSRHCGAYTIN